MKYRPTIGSTQRARHLRKNLTDAERAMWNLLRANFPEARFRCQVPLLSYTADFASQRAKLVIEVDGGQHTAEKDADRTARIRAEGYRLIRFWNHDVLGNSDGVAAAIAAVLAEKPLPSMGRGWGGVASPDMHHASLTPPPPNPPPSRGRASYATSESAFIASLRALATHPAARGLLDDAAVLPIGGTSLVLTHDMIVEGVHFLPGDPAEDVAWKLLAVNLSDLAAKGARPIGALLGYSLCGDDGWNGRFVAGLGEALAHFGVPLLGGDTVALPEGAPRSLGLTAIGETAVAPPRSGARDGDMLWVSGTIGDAGAGLRILADGGAGPAELIARYRRPLPRLALGAGLAPLVGAMMDVSDGLLIDAGRMASASGRAVEIDLDLVPLSPGYVSLCGNDRAARLAAATAGDDYELLFAAAADRKAGLRAAALAAGVQITCIGRFSAGSTLRLTDASGPVPLPNRLGWEHA
jgi:thiamine-monophosphate kinase